MGIFKYLKDRLVLGRAKKVYIVSGLPRSGTSMMMKMLEAGGIEVFIDNIRVPDEDNPKGYYEFERVKQLAKDASWMADAMGKVVKVISMLLEHLPCEYKYKIVFMQREMDEILVSQAKMLERSGKSGGNLSDRELAERFKRHLDHIETWLEGQPNIRTLYVNYNALIRSPHEILEKINRFMDNTLETGKMLDIIDPTLYRQRKKRG